MTSDRVSRDAVQEALIDHHPLSTTHPHPLALPWERWKPERTIVLAQWSEQCSPRCCGVHVCVHPRVTLPVLASVDTLCHCLRPQASTYGAGAWHENTP